MMRIRSHRLASAALATTLFTAACGTTAILDPVDPEVVTIELWTTGGFAGVNHSVIVDGAEGVVRVSCALCGSPIDPQYPISEAQIVELARMLDELGTLALDGTDFGDQCCDMFGLRLRYDRGEQSAVLQGTDQLWPPRFQPVLRRLAALQYGAVPMLIAPDTDASDWPGDPIELLDVEVASGRLTAEVRYGGGCGQHRMDLVAVGGWLESNPVQVDVLLTHDDGDDPCDAIATEARTFDLVPLREAYEEAYGPIGSEHPRVVLRLRAPGAAAIQVEVTL